MRGRGLEQEIPGWVESNWAADEFACKEKALTKPPPLLSHQSYASKPVLHQQPGGKNQPGF